MSLSISPAELFADDLVERVAVRVAELLGPQLAPAEPSPWLSAVEAAEYLRCAPKRVYDLASQHRIPVHRDGSRLLFTRDELDAYVLADEDADDTALTPVPDRPRLRGVSPGARTNDPQVTELRRNGR